MTLRHYASFGETSQGPATYLTYRENQQAFEDIGAWDGTTVSIIGGGETPRTPHRPERGVAGRFLAAEDALDLGRQQRHD